LGFLGNRTQKISSKNGLVDALFALGVEKVAPGLGIASFTMKRAAVQVSVLEYTSRQRRRGTRGVLAVCRVIVINIVVIIVIRMLGKPRAQSAEILFSDRTPERMGLVWSGLVSLVLTVA
jgi:hypothetical protein